MGVTPVGGGGESGWAGSCQPLCKPGQVSVHPGELLRKVSSVGAPRGAEMARPWCPCLPPPQLLSAKSESEPQATGGQLSLPLSQLGSVATVLSLCPQVVSPARGVSSRGAPSALPGGRSPTGGRHTSPVITAALGAQLGLIPSFLRCADYLSSHTPPPLSPLQALGAYLGVGPTSSFLRG